MTEAPLTHTHNYITETCWITGGAGFIGSNLANHIAERNHVIAIDGCPLGTLNDPNESAELHELDVLEDGLLDDVGIMFHLAVLLCYQMRGKIGYTAKKLNFIIKILNR